MNSAITHLINKYSSGGNRIGWLMIASIFIEAWDLYSISFVLIFIKQIYHPNNLMLGLASGGTQAGALVGAMLGGWMTDKFGRRKVFMTTMVMFIIFGFAQAFAPNMMALAIIRFFLGLPLGADIANGYTYIMEFMKKGDREVMGNRWQFMFAVGEIIAIGVILIFILTKVNNDTLWRIILGMSCLPAVILFILRWNLPETAIWLIQKGRFVEAKKVSQQIYGDSLDMLPNEDVKVNRPNLGAFLREIKKDRVAWKATQFGWISNFVQGFEFSTFSFYTPVIIAMLGVAGTTGNDLIMMVLYIIAAISGWVGPLFTAKYGQRSLSLWGFGIVFISLILGAVALFTGEKFLFPFVCALMLWGHYWDAENGMTIVTVVAPPKYRGTASGFAYMFVKAAGFVGLLFFPTIIADLGEGGATLFVAIFPLIAWLAAKYILPEMFGYEETTFSPTYGDQENAPPSLSID